MDVHAISFYHESRAALLFSFFFSCFFFIFYFPSFLPVFLFPLLSPCSFSFIQCWGLLHACHHWRISQDLRKLKFNVPTSSHHCLCWDSTPWDFKQSYRFLLKYKISVSSGTSLQSTIATADWSWQYWSFPVWNCNYEETILLSGTFVFLDWRDPTAPPDPMPPSLISRLWPRSCWAFQLLCWIPGSVRGKKMGSAFRVSYLRMTSQVCCLVRIHWMIWE